MNDEASKKKKQAEMFKKYLDQTGIAMAFQVIFAEILDKKIDESKLFAYTAMRLRQIGEDLEKIKIVRGWLFRARSDVSLFDGHLYLTIVKKGRKGKGRKGKMHISLSGDRCLTIVVNSDARSVWAWLVIAANAVKTGTFVPVGRGRGTLGRSPAEIGTVCLANIVLKRYTVSVMPAEVLSLSRTIVFPKDYVLRVEKSFFLSFCLNL